jgi:hypothetical protein
LVKAGTSHDHYVTPPNEPLTAGPGNQVSGKGYAPLELTGAAAF